jgi:hypothetical protein
VSRSASASASAGLLACSLVYHMVSEVKIWFWGVLLMVLMGIACWCCESHKIPQRVQYAQAPLYQGSKAGQRQEQFPFELEVAYLRLLVSHRRLLVL